MSKLDLLLSRFSCGSLQQPVPSQEQLHQILSTAMRAPDHGKLRPWRFIHIPEESRSAWIENLKIVMNIPEYNYPESYVQKVIHNFSTAPMILALGCRKITEKTSVSLDEQLMATSSAVMNVLNAIHALGFAAKWITGPIDNKELRNSLGFPEPYRMMGFMFIGTSTEGCEEPPRVAIDDYVAVWQGQPVKFKVDIE